MWLQTLLKTTLPHFLPEQLAEWLRHIRSPVAAGLTRSFSEGLYEENEDFELFICCCFETGSNYVAQVITNAW